MLRRQHDRIDGDGLVIFVKKRYLTLGVRTQIRQLAAFAYLCLTAHEELRIRYRGRHKNIGFIRRVAEHEALVAGPLQLSRLSIDALCDIRGLLADRIENGTRRTVKAHARAVVADLEHGIAHDIFHIHPGRRRDFTRDDSHARLDHGLAGNARLRVLLNNGVEDCVGDLVGDLVGMTLGNRFRREQEGVTHVI